MNIDRDSIEAVVRASEEFSDECCRRVDDLETQVRRIRESGEIAIKRANELCEQFPPVIDSLEKSQQEHGYAIRGAEQLIEDTTHEIESRQVTVDALLREADEWENQASSLMSRASEVRHEGLNQEDGSGYYAVADECESRARECESKAAKCRSQADELKKQIEGFETLRRSYEDGLNKERDAMEQCERSLSDTRTRYTESQYRRDDMVSSINSAIDNASNSLRDAQDRAEYAMNDARRIKDRAEEVYAIIDDYYRDI